ncbi:MAG: DUF6498-containing protein [Gemmatimonadota bacterium]|nr:DUF6498-containing protein [Gemmatimonadota bacterium]
MRPSWLPTVALVAANLVVVALTLFSAWGFYQLILVYWCEALIIGAFNMARMVAVGLLGEPLGRWVGVANVPSRVLLLALALGFFVVEFGGFALGLGFLITALPAMLGQPGDGVAREIWRGLRAVGSGVGVAALALTLSHGLSFVTNFLGRREYRRTNLLVLLVWPYVRMSLVMVALGAGLAAAAAVPTFGASTAFGVAVVLVKTVADLVVHRIEHGEREGGAAVPVVAR